MENTDTSNPAGTQDPIAENIRKATKATRKKVAQTEEEISKQTDELKAAMSELSEAAQTALTALGEQFAVGARTTDRMIREKPYQSAGIALGVGLLIGYSIKRK